MDDQELPAPPPPSDADPTAEQKLYWLNALQVVGDWSVHDDGDGRLFYYDRRADSSQWEVPESLAPLETEFMMKLMLQNAVARSGAWTAHDAGNGTLYYFNSKTRVSAWERPSEWGEQEAAAAAEAREREAVALLARQAEEAQRQEVEKAAKKEKKEKREKKKHKKHKKQKEKRDDEAGAEHKTEDKEANEEEPTRQENVEEEEPLTAEEVQEEEERKAREQKRIELFRAMLRDKNIMPFCKWSVALPQIAGDPRFMGVPTMDERRAIFEHFVEHRREDLKAEKKSKLKQARQLFAQLLREQFQLDSWDPKTTLSVFLSTLEEHLHPERYKQLHDDALALLTLSAQEKLYAKAVAEYKTEALKRDGEQLRLTKFLEDAFASLDMSTMRWESDEVQKLVRAFYGSAASSGESEALLSAQRQQQVFDELVVRTARSRQPVRGEGESKRLHSPRSPTRDRVPSNDDYKRQDTSSRRESSNAHHGRYRSRSHSRRRRSRSRSSSRSRSHSRRRRSRSRSNSRSRSRGRERGHRSRRSSRRRSVSSSRSRSREERSSRSRHHHRYSSSPSRSRSRTR